MIEIIAYKNMSSVTRENVGNALHTYIFFNIIAFASPKTLTLYYTTQMRWVFKNPNINILSMT